MLNRCFTCLDDNPVYPVIPKATFVQNETVWMAEPSNFAAIIAPKPITPLITNYPKIPRATFGAALEPQPLAPLRTVFPQYRPVTFGQVERTPAQKVAAVLVGGAMLFGLFQLAGQK